MVSANSPEGVQYQYESEVWADYGLGTVLRSFREAYGQTLYQVSDQLKIRAVYLQYLEDGHYDGLPGYAHGLGFLKAYAQFLGLPPEEMVARYRADTGVEEPVAIRPVKASPLQRLERQIPLRTTLGVILCVLVVGYLGSFLFNELNFGRNDAPSLVKRFNLFFLNRESMAPDNSVDPALGTSPAGTVTTLGAAAGRATPSSGPTTAPNAVTREPTSGPSQPPPRILRSEDRPVLQRGEVFRPQVKPNMAELVGEVGTITVGRAPAALAGSEDLLLASGPIISPLAVRAPSPAAVDDGTLAGLSSFGSGPIVIGPAPSEPAAVAPPQPATTAAAITAATANTPPAPLAEPITITATAITWVQIRNAAGELVRASVLRLGESLEAPLEPNLTLSVESFEKIDITVSGRRVPTPQSIDPRGSVFPLDAERLRQGL